jgi:hypothetical protein
VSCSYGRCKFKVEIDVRTNLLKLARGIIALRCDYRAEYTNILREAMRYFVGLVLMQDLEYCSHCVSEDASSFIILSPSC